MQGKTQAAARVAAMMAATALLAAGCATPPANTVTQLALPGAQRPAAARDWRLHCGDLSQYGDFGTARPDRLEGLVLLLDGRCWMVQSSGRVSPPPDGLCLANATLVRFQWDQTLSIRERTSRANVEALLDRAIGERGALCAVKLSGRFLSLNTRKAFASSDSGAGPETVEYPDIGGTLVGFRFPEHLRGVCAPGYHFYFLSQNRQYGGEVVDFLLQDGVAEVDACARYLLVTGKD